MVKEERRLRAEIAGLLDRAEAVDEAEDARYGEEVRGDELPEEFKRREDRLAAIREAKARLEEEQRARDDARGRKPEQARNPKGGRPYKRAYGEPDEKAQSNFTDPESRIMKTSSEGFQQCYNAQTVVEGENQLVVATTVTDNASDQGQLIPMVDAVADTCGEMPRQVLADASYCNERDLKRLEARDIDGMVSLAREGKAGVERRSGQASREGAHGREAGERRGPDTVRTPKVDGGGARRLDQGGDGISKIQLPGPEEGPGRVDPRVPGRSTSSGCTLFRRHETAIVDPRRGPRCFRRSPRPPYAAARPSRSVSDPDPNLSAPESVKPPSALSPSVPSTALPRRKLLGRLLVGGPTRKPT